MAALLHSDLQATASATPERVALRAGDDTWTFADLDAASNAFARYLASQGVGARDRVALMCSNRPEFFVVVQAVSRLGGACVLISPAWKEKEIAHAIALTGPVAGVADGDGLRMLRTHLKALSDLDEFDTLVAGMDRSALDVAAPLETDESVLVFSSGTTGLPKAARHTHRSLSIATAHWCAALGLTAEDRFQIATPPSHILGLLNLLAAASAGVTVRLHMRFDLDEVLRRIGEERMTLEMAVAPIALAMANHPDLESFDLSSLRYIMWGATPVTESVAQRVTDRTGVRWLPAYGASELPVLACNPVNDPANWRLDSAGLPPAGVELRIVDLDSGEVLPSGEVGEIQARSESVMAGYLPDSASAEVFDDGWYRTGDVGWLEPQGWVHLTDRSKEMVKVNGFQVAPAELEAVLHGHPAVLDCAVFGIADERTGEAPVAAVQLDPSIAVADGELQELVAKSLATYKQLRHVVVVETIPRLPSGKVLRRALRDEWAPRLTASSASA